MDSLDSPKKKLEFKKRSHRPWNPAIQENTSALLEYNNKLNSFDNDRLLIGGFSFPAPSLSSYESEQSPKSLALLDELKNKEQEIQELSTNLKIASALEHAEKIELSRKKEALARQAAEEKALFAAQQVKLAEEQLQKARQQIQIEQQLKIKEEILKKSLETEIKNAIATIEDNENAIAHEVGLRKIAEEKLSETLKFLSEKENTLRLEAEKIVKDNLRDFIEQEKISEQSFEDRVNALKHAQREQILELQTEISQKVAEAQEKVQQHERAKLATEELLHRSQETISQTESEKTAIAHNLAVVTQCAMEQKLEFETAIKNYMLNIQQLDEKINSMAIANVELKKQLSDAIAKLGTTEKAEIDAATKINNLNLQIKALTEKVATLSTEKTELTTQLTDSLGRSKILQSIGNNERQLRKLLEEKLNDSGLRKIELNKKLFENKILELAERIASLEIAKSQVEEKHHDALENIHKMEIFMSAETAIKKSLEEKNKVMTEQTTQLEIALNHEKSVSKNLEEALSIVTKKQHDLEHKKVSAEEKFDQIFTYANELEFKLGDEKSVRTSLEKNLETTLNQKQSLEKEKETWEEKHNALKTRIFELEKMLASEKLLRNNAEQLQEAEAPARKTAQEKIATLEQANKTILNVLGNYTTTDATNAET